MHIRKDELSTLTAPYLRINPKWIRDLNVSAKTIKLSGKNIGENLHDLWLGKDFLDTTAKT